jgi:hypothetical protein
MPRAYDRFRLRAKLLRDHAPRRGVETFYAQFGRAEGERQSRHPRSLFPPPMRGHLPTRWAPLDDHSTSSAARKSSILRQGHRLHDRLRQQAAHLDPDPDDGGAQTRPDRILTKRNVTAYPSRQRRRVDLQVDLQPGHEVHRPDQPANAVYGEPANGDGGAASQRRHRGSVWNYTYRPRCQGLVRRSPPAVVCHHDWP